MRLFVAITCYNCEKQLPRVLDKLDKIEIKCWSEVVIIDNQSCDQTVNVASQIVSKFTSGIYSVLKNNENYGLGGSHKVAYKYAVANGYDGFVILHGDDQGNIADFKFDEKALNDNAALLGARFMTNSELTGYSKFRVFGNVVFNSIYTIISKCKTYDMGSGLNFFNIRKLDEDKFVLLPNDLTFNNAFLLYLISSNLPFKFFPISWREEDQVSNARLFSQSKKLINYIFSFVLNKSNFKAPDFVKKRSYDYSLCFRRNS